MEKNIDELKKKVLELRYTIDNKDWYLNREISRIKKESTETQWLPNVMNCNRKINKEGGIIFDY